MKLQNAAVIGAGPAGVAAAIQLQRYGLRPLVFECGSIGGLIRNANLVENLPGFPGGIPGMALASLIEQQADDMALRFVREKVTRLECDSDHFVVETEHETYAFSAVVVASGTKPVVLEDIIPPTAAEPHIYYEIESLLFERDRNIAIIGGGDCAFDYALNLARHNRVAVIFRRQQPTCLALLADRAGAIKNVEVRPNTRLTGVRVGDTDRLHLEISKGDQPESLVTDLLVFAIGRRPRLDFWQGSLNELIDIALYNPLLHIVGDVKNGPFRQTAIAMGDGVRAAMEIYQHLKDNN